MEIIAEFDFQPGNPDEVKFAAGDIMRVLDMSEDPNWFKVEHCSTKSVGFVPRNYVKPYKKTPEPAPPPPAAPRPSNAVPAVCYAQGVSMPGGNQRVFRVPSGLLPSQPKLPQASVAGPRPVYAVPGPHPQQQRPVYGVPARGPVCMLGKRLPAPGNPSLDGSNPRPVGTFPRGAPTANASNSATAGSRVARAPLLAGQVPSVGGYGQSRPEETGWPEHQPRQEANWPARAPVARSPASQGFPRCPNAQAVPRFAQGGQRLPTARPQLAAAPQSLTPRLATTSPSKSFSAQRLGSDAPPAKNFQARSFQSAPQSKQNLPGFPPASKDAWPTNKNYPTRSFSATVFKEASSNSNYAGSNNVAASSMVELTSAPSDKVSEANAFERQQAEQRKLTEMLAIGPAVAMPGRPDISALHCKLCDVFCSGGASYTAHLNGVKHKKRLESAQSAVAQAATTEAISTATVGKSGAMFHCNVCNISCSSDQVYQMHIKGKPHEKRLRSLRMLESVTVPQANETAASNSAIAAHATSVTTSGGPIVDGQTYLCTLCSVPCCGQTAYEAHLVGKKHVKMEKRIKDRMLHVQGFACQLCGVDCQSQVNFDAHFGSAKHLENEKQHRTSLMLKLKYATDPAQKEQLQTELNLLRTRRAEFDTVSSKEVASRAALYAGGPRTPPPNPENQAPPASVTGQKTATAVRQPPVVVKKPEEAKQSSPLVAKKPEAKQLTPASRDQKPAEVKQPSPIDTSLALKLMPAREIKPAAVGSTESKVVTSSSSTWSTTASPYASISNVKIVKKEPRKSLDDRLKEALEKILPKKNAEPDSTVAANNDKSASVTSKKDEVKRPSSDTSTEIPAKRPKEMPAANDYGIKAFSEDVWSTDWDPVLPHVGDWVKMSGCFDGDIEGELVGIEGADGLVQTTEGEIRLCAMKNISKKAKP